MAGSVAAIWSNIARWSGDPAQEFAPRLPQTVAMADPHVQALYYRFKSLNDLDMFDKAVPLTGTLGDFDFALDSGMLTARPQSHFGDRDSARDALDPYLRSWEWDAFLSPANHRVEFAYDHADVVDRHPEAGSVAFAAEFIQVQGFAMNATVKRDNGRYPEPDASFSTTPLTDGLAERLRRVRDREAEVPATANYVLTAVVEEYGPGGQSRRARRAAASALSVDFEILDTMGKLAAYADPDIGRKAGGPQLAFTAAEVVWLREAMAKLIRRTGELGAGPPIRTLSMSDLPQLQATADNLPT